MTFGETIRRARMAKKITLRNFSAQVGVSPTYISQIERDEYDPPSVERLQKIAALLELNADELIALAKRTPPDFAAAFQKHPQLVADFLRQIKDLNPDRMKQLSETINKELSKDKE